jgi:hypothetical protein
MDASIRFADEQVRAEVCCALLFHDSM